MLWSPSNQGLHQTPSV
uniref:Uncharacterized protein n=1 Tax=Arundo donax TaxID=35708 RepID=A0A0A9C3V9_ARUDO